jgi:hypothetical protein
MAKRRQSVQTQMTASETAAPVVASNPWMKPSDYARRKGITRQTVWNWVRKGLLQVSRKASRTGVRVRESS